MLEILTLIILLIFGILLILAEVLFVPGTTLVGLFGLFFSGVGIYLTFNNYGMNAGWIVVIVNVIVVVSAIIYGLKANVWKKLSLNSTLTSTFNSEHKIPVAIGEVGITLSDLKPFGKVEFKEGIVEAKTLGTFLDAGSRVRVIKSEFNSIIVETLTS